MKDKILVIQELSAEQLDDLAKVATNYEIIHSLDGVDLGTVKILLGWDDDFTPLIKKDQLKVEWVQFTSAGVEHLPLELFKEKNIQLTNGSGTNSHAVTESTMGLILGMTRNIVKASHKQEKEMWDQDYEPYELNDKTLLIVGAGEIGERLGKVAKAFDMKTIGINRSGRPISYMDESYMQAELPKIIEAADIIVSILPATSETKGFFDASLFQKMKDQVIFVNVGRGETVVTEDLLNALNTGKVKHAALDVFEEEPLPKGHPLWSHKQVLMTPHIAGNVEDKSHYIYPIFVENLVAFENRNKLPINRVELDTGY